MIIPLEGAIMAKDDPEYIGNVSEDPSERFPAEFHNNKWQSEALNRITRQEMKNNSKDNALLVTNAKKAYGRGKYSTVVLNNFCMQVEKGTIYSLLGSSGCGKTTLLSSVVGLKQLDAGNILVFGSPPGTRASGVPGKKIGYMPQEIALVGELSIDETMRYFSSLYGMTSDLVKRNIEFLQDFLKLPPSERRINTLSGGQQRRVSFAVALIHNPEMLILDEPTVGVDPLLRKSIWTHLINLVSTGKTTVIITTHYIEEARESHRVGLMRNGRLLAEDSPETLLRKYDTDLLEDIVLQLCLQDNSATNEENKDWINENSEITFTNKGSFKRIQDENENEKKIDEKVVGLKYRKRDPDLWDPIAVRKWDDFQRHNSLQSIYDESASRGRFRESIQRLVALTNKSILMFTRNLVFLFFVALLPAVQVILICAAIGGDLGGLKLGVVNEDANGSFANSNVSDFQFDFKNQGCILDDNYTDSISLHFLSLMSKSSFSLISYDSEEQAFLEVKAAKLYGYVHFASNFTESLKDRIMFGVNAEIDTIVGSKINFHLDISAKQVAEEMKRLFYKAFALFMTDVANACNLAIDRIKSPVVFREPIFGTEDTPFTEFIAPSILLGILFFFPLLATGVSYITEAKSGILARSQVAGVTKLEIMISYSITHVSLLLIQTGLAFGVMILAFNIKIQGSLVLAIVLSLLVGLAGISVGFLYTTFCTEEIQAVLLAKGTFFPNFIISGMVWPSIGMPKALQYFAFVLPCTLACETLRSIVSRGADFKHPAVWPGFVSIILWILFYWILTIFLSRIANKK